MASTRLTSIRPLLSLRASTLSSLLALLLGGAACGGGESTSGTGGTAGTGASGGGGATTGGGGTGGFGGSTGTGAGGQGGTPVTAACAASTLPTPSLDCALPEVLCVDDTAGPTQEHSTIQAAADAAGPGDTIVVHEGTYAGFEVDTSGTADAPIVFFANGDVLIATPASTGDGIRLQNVSHVRVIGFRVEDPSERCIAARGATPDEPMTDLWIVGNQCHRSITEGFYLSEVSDSHVELNVIADTGVLGDIRSHGIYLANAGSDGTTICGNVISGATADESNGIHMNGDLSIGGDGIISGVLVEANLIFGNQQNGFNLDGVQDSVFRNNVVWGNGRNALRGYAIDAAQGPKNLVVAGNTFLTPNGAGWPLKLTQDEGGHVVFDNILLTDDPDTGSIALADSPSFASASNIVVDRFTPDDESTIVSLAEWQSLGFDAGSFLGSGAALFVAPGSDFHLLPGCPAIDAGLASFETVAAPATDLDGVARPQGAGFDVGAYEATP